MLPRGVSDVCEGGGGVYLQKAVATDPMGGRRISHPERVFTEEGRARVVVYYCRFSAITMGLNLPCLSPLKCTETPLFWDKGKRAPVTGTGLDWIPAAVQSQTPLRRGALALALLYHNCVKSSHSTIYCLYL